MSDPLITSNPNMSSKKMWIAGGVFVAVVAVALLLYFFVFKKSSKSQPQLQPPSMQMQSPQLPSMKMKIGRRFNNLSIGTGVHCESDNDCLDGNGCGLVTGDPNKQCCKNGVSRPPSSWPPDPIFYSRKIDSEMDPLYQQDSLNICI